MFTFRSFLGLIVRDEVHYANARKDTYSRAYLRFPSRLPSGGCESEILEHLLRS